MTEKKTPMTKEDASRIQSNTDKKGGGDGFKERSQRAAEKNSRVGGSSNQGGSSKGNKK